MIMNLVVFPQVSYVDFGNSEVVSLSAIRQEMPFMEVPNQCLQLVLRGIEPVSSSLVVTLTLIRKEKKEKNSQIFDESGR